MGCGCNNKNKAPAKGATYANRVNNAINKDTGFLMPGKGEIETNQNPVPMNLEEPAKSPSLLKKALSLGEALATHVADGMGKVSKVQMATRLAVCERCPHRAASECTKCGCTLTVKAAWRTSECPDERWPIFTEENKD